jgi:hypothetical protein
MKKIGFVLVLLAVIFIFVSSESAFAMVKTDTITTAQRDTAIARGLRWLAAQQNQDSGYVEDPDISNFYRVSLTAFAVLKWEEHAKKFTSYDPFDPAYEYSDEIIRGWKYIFNHAHICPVDTQPAGWPESGKRDSLGVFFVSDAPAQSPLYETGIVMMTLEASCHPDDTVDTGPLNGKTYKEVMQEMVDYVSWAQNDAPNSGEGGWRYTPNRWDSDNSVSQWPVLGLMSARAWNIEAPQFVRDELKDHWLKNSQGSTDGCFGYAGPPPSQACNTGCAGFFGVTASGLIQLTYCGVTTDSSRWDLARQCICSNWDWLYYNNPLYPGNIGNLYAMYALMKAAMTAQPNPVWDFGGDECPPWQPQYDSVLVAVQDSIYASTGQGYWPERWSLPWAYSFEWSKVLATEYALLILQKVAPPTPHHGTVEIPNEAYERFGYAHWVYPDTGIYLDDACEPYYGVNPGDFFEIPIILKDFNVPIGGFELEVDYDYIDLTFYGAEPGRLLSQRWYTPTIPDSTLWSWEYFTYRVLPCPLCACCKYKILLYGQAEMPDGLYRRGYCIGTPVDDETYWGEDYATYIHKNGEWEQVKVGATLVWLKFQVANNELLRDLKLPIVFEWEHKLSPNYPYHIVQDWDCAENTMSDCKGERLFVSKDTMQYDPHVCPYLPSDQRILNFVDGGVHICSICTAFVCVRGDVNMDGNAYTTADAVMFARALIFGAENVFTINLAKQKCATDANADGRNMMLSDLIYMIRVIQHDATPFPKLGPSSDVANLIVSDGRITVECASAIGGLLFEFDGAVTPTLLNTNMELLSKDGKVLVWSSEGHCINAGTSELLAANGANLVSVMAVDREGRDLTTTINAKVTPTTFALHPAYPNPFNPFTNLSFTLPNAVFYSMNIYNVAGQLVRSYEDMGTVGLNVITWDGKNNAGNDVSSGIYFYKLVAGPYQAINKMVMLK